MAKSPAPHTTFIGARTVRRTVDIDLEDVTSFEEVEVLAGLSGLEALGFQLTTLSSGSDEEEAPEAPVLSEWYTRNMETLAVNAPLRELAQQRRKQRTSVSRSQASRLHAAYREEMDLAALMSEAPSR